MKKPDFGKIKTFFEKYGRKIGIMTVKVLIVCAVVTAICLGTYSIAAYSNLRITVDLADEKQTIEGFGASAAWTFQRMGATATEEVKDQAMEMLYGESGLELNTIRFNIGGGSADAALDNVAPYNNPSFDRDRRAESFFIAENYVDNSSFLDVNNYDFENRDKDMLEMFERALASGNIEKVVFFANSPHYKMTVSGTCTGAEVQQNNLREDCYEAFCDYLLLIVDNLAQRYLYDLPNVPEIVISPVNEPQWDWGGPNASQEGCHFDPEPLAKFYDVFFDKVEQYNAEHSTSFVGDAFECGNYKEYWYRDDIKDYLKAMSKYDYFEDLRYISAHSYGADDSVSIRKEYQNFVSKKYPDLGISITEYCEMEWGRFDTMDSGLLLGKVISRDLTMLNAIDWSWWLAVSSGDYNDGLVYWDTLENGEQKLSVLRRYYVMGHFSKYLDKGDVRVNATCSDLTGWAKLDYSVFRKADGSVVLIVINDLGKEQTVSVGGLSEYKTYSSVLTTQTDNWTPSEGNWEGKVTLPAHSIMTFVLSK